MEIPSLDNNPLRSEYVMVGNLMHRSNVRGDAQRWPGRMHSLSDAKRWKLFSRVENPTRVNPTEYWAQVQVKWERKTNDMKGVRTDER